MFTYGFGYYSIPDMLKEGWAPSAVEDPTTIATNGPFSIAAWNENGMTLKRNAYYYLEGISTENKQKYVNVDKIYIKFADAKNAEEIYNMESRSRMKCCNLHTTKGLNYNQMANFLEYVVICTPRRA